jgi:hypothetical protein
MITLLVILARQNPFLGGPFFSGYQFEFAHPCSSGSYYLGGAIAKDFNETAPGDPARPQPGGVFYNCRESFWLSEVFGFQQTGQTEIFGQYDPYSLDMTVRITRFNYNPLP